MTTRDEIETSMLHAKKFGHGHVFPRTDGVRARCGGGSLCPQCKADGELLATAKKNEVLWRSEDAAAELDSVLTELSCVASPEARQAAIARIITKHLEQP